MGGGVQGSCSVYSCGFDTHGQSVRLIGLLCLCYVGLMNLECVVDGGGGDGDGDEVIDS